MKILSVGYHNPSFINSMVYREDAIKGLGHELVSFDDRDYVLPGRVRKLLPLLKDWDVRRLNERLVQTALKEVPDLLLVVGGYSVLPESIDAIRSGGIKTALWTSDAPIKVDGPTAIPRDFENIIASAPKYDHVFCAGSEAVEILSANGVDAKWLTFACDPEYHYPVGVSDAERERYQKDIVFVGSYYKNREKVLESVADMDIGVWGPSWSGIREGSPLEGKVFDVRLAYKEWVRIYSSAKMVVVVNYDDGKTLCHQASPKLYEALACKSFVLVDNKPDARRVFKDKEQVVFFDGAKDLREKALYYLEASEERQRIASSGYREVIEKHTYKDRIREMFKEIFG